MNHPVFINTLFEQHQKSSNIFPDKELAVTFIDTFFEFFQPTTKLCYSKGVLIQRFTTPKVCYSKGSPTNLKMSKVHR